MSDSPNAEGSTPVSENAEGATPQGGNPWLKMVPKETAEKYNEVLTGYDSFNSFIDGSIESMNTLKEFKEKYDGVAVVPGETADEATWQQYYRQLGKPEEASGYGIEEETLASIFHKANLTKTQADDVAAGLIEFNDVTTKGQDAKRKVDYEASVKAMQEKYGDDLEVTMKTAQTALSNLGGPKLVSLLQEKGLDNDPQMIDFFVNVGTLMKEGNIPVGHALKPETNGLAGSYTTMEGLD